MKQIIFALWAGFMLIALPLRAEVDIQEITTPDGHSAWLVEDHTIPFMSLNLAFKGGASLDAPGKRGATSLMMALLEEGTGDMDARAFASAVDALAASFSYDARDDAVTISARMLSENRGEALKLLRGALVKPRFDQSAIDRVRKQVVSIIQSSQKDPSDIAMTAFDAATFGDHPYATSSDGTVDSVTALTRDDIQDAYKGAIATDRVYISAVGDITAAELTQLIDDLLRDLPATGAPMPQQAQLEMAPGIFVTPFDTPQSVAVFGHSGIKRDDPDFFAAFVANTIFGGGGFNSRLMDEVREKRGLTYGIYSYIGIKDHAEIIAGQFSSANDRIADAIDVVKDEWRRFAEEGVTQEELDEAKTYLTGAYPLRFDGNGPIANILVGMQMDDLPTSYIATRNDKVNAVTLEDINRVIKRLYRPDALHFTVVGQPAGL
ncbi:MAG: pitrilysin family protein [Pseudomonadota bacterium]